MCLPVSPRVITNILTPHHPGPFALAPVTCFFSLFGIFGDRVLLLTEAGFELIHYVAQDELTILLPQCPQMHIAMYHHTQLLCALASHSSCD